MYAKATWGQAGCNPANLYITSQSVPAPQFALGTVVTGDGGAEWTFCKLVLGSTTSLTNGQAYVIDKDFTASLLSTANSPRGASVGVANIVAASQPAGTYYLWLQTAGHAPVVYTGSGNALAETTSTGGLLNFNNTSTSTTKRIVGVFMFGTNQTFTADNTNGGFTLNNVSSLNDVAIGATLAGTGVGSGAKVVSFGTNNGVNQITVDTASTATNTGQTITQTGVYTANLSRPFVDLTNP